MSASAVWPVVAGTYEVGDPAGPVAICVLTTEALIAPLANLTGVAITGKVNTANLGITRIVVNVTANPAIRFMLICGKDSPIFHPGQSLAALAERGVDADRRISGAIGYEPVLPTLTAEHIERFRRQVEVIDWSGEEDPAVVGRGVDGLMARNPGRFAGGDGLPALTPATERFTPIRPGGVREPLVYDPKGYFVITLDRADESILLRHYLPDHTAAHQMRGRSAGPMVLGLLREGLVSQLSHAGYLGEELAKAEAALRLDVRYDQDRPLRPRAVAAANPDVVAPDGGASAPGAAAASPAPPPSPMASIQPALSVAQLDATAPGMTVDVVLAVTDLPAPDRLGGMLLEADDAEPFSVYHRTSRRLTVRWSPTTRIVMGGPPDLAVGALVRARGRLIERDLVDAETMAILTRVARVIED